MQVFSEWGLKRYPVWHTHDRGQTKQLHLYTELILNIFAFLGSPVMNIWTEYYGWENEVWQQVIKYNMMQEYLIQLWYNYDYTTEK
jgi:hypothetical protein